MKKLEIVKIISILLVFVSVISILSGCGDAVAGTNTDEIKFREIPFGTKYSKAIPIIKEDLEKQGYMLNIMTKQNQDGTRIIATATNIKLDDYNNVDLTMIFLKKENEDEDDAILILGSYSITRFPEPKKENADKCYNYFDAKLKEIYGDKNKLWEDKTVEGWKKGDTICYINQIERNENPEVYIWYEFDNIDAFVENYLNN